MEEGVRALGGEAKETYYRGKIDLPQRQVRALGGEAPLYIYIYIIYI